MHSFSSLALFALAYVSCLANASPLVARSALDVAAPPVTYPTKGVVWKAGETQTVTWDTSKLPTQITNPIGKVVLGWLGGDGLNLQLDAPLAENFPITAGKVDIVVPSQYPDGDTYIIALIGNSGNISPTFTITGGSSSSDIVDLPPSSISKPPAQPTPVHGTPPSTTPSSSSVVYDAPSSPKPSSSIPPSSTSSSLRSSSISSPLSTGTPGNPNGTTSSGNSAWVNRPSNVMVSLLAASLVTLFL